MATLPLKSDFQSFSNNITSFTVTIEGLSVNSPNGTSISKLSNMDADAILDSGSTISLFPLSEIQDIWDKLDIRHAPDVDLPFVDCAYGGEKGNGITFSFQFAGKNISVPMDEMVVDAFSEIQGEIFHDPVLGKAFQGWEGACMFGIGSSDNFGVSQTKFALLGDTFLRSAYVVYDLANEQLGLAQANLNSTNTDIVDLKAEDKNLPGAEGVASKTSGHQTFTRSDIPSYTFTDQTPPSGSSNNDSEDDDSAGGHVTPGLAATLVMAISTVLAVL